MSEKDLKTENLEARIKSQEETQEAKLKELTDKLESSTTDFDYRLSAKKDQINRLQEGAVLKKPEGNEEDNVDFKLGEISLQMEGAKQRIDALGTSVEQLERKQAEHTSELKRLEELSSHKKAPDEGEDRFATTAALAAAIASLDKSEKAFDAEMEGRLKDYVDEAMKKSMKDALKGEAVQDLERRMHMALVDALDTIKGEVKKELLPIEAEVKALKEHQKEK